MSREYPDRPIVGVGAIVWRGEQILMIRRGKPPRLGQWSLPGGAQQLGETVEEAIRREVREETGLELGAVRFLTTVDLVDRDAEGRVRYHYTLLDYTAEAVEGEPIAGDDAAEVAWFELGELTGLGLWSETVRVVEASRLQRRSERDGPARR